jgi:putative transposase
MTSILSPEKIQEIKNLTIVKKVTKGRIIFTDEFKKLAIQEWKNGAVSRIVFENFNFPLSYFNKQYARTAVKKWRDKEFGKIPKPKKKKAITNENEFQVGDLLQKKSLDEMTKEETKHYIALLESTVTYLGKFAGFKKKVKPEIKNLIIFEAHEKDQSLKIKYLCKLMNAAENSYHYWKKHRFDKDNKDKNILNLMLKYFDESKKIKGAERIKMDLKSNENKIVNLKKLYRLKKKHNIYAIIRQPNPHKQFAKKMHESKTFPNLVKRHFNPSKPDKIYSTDITYITLAKGRRAYLSATRDLCTKEIVHWNISQNLKMEVVTDGLTTKLKTLSKDVREKLIIHSDQGVHYTNPAYSKILKNLNITQSMSRKGNCHDNSPIESYFGHMKDEINFKSFENFEAMKIALDKYIHYYNEERYVWGLGGLTPIEKRAQLLVA